METKLYHLPGCPYCARAIAKIDELGLRDKIKFIAVPGPHDERTELLAVTGGPVGVPTLVCGFCGEPHVIADDDDAIIAHLEEKFGEK